jgi:hypothetical protein
MKALTSPSPEFGGWASSENRGNMEVGAVDGEGFSC